MENKFIELSENISIEVFNDTNIGIINFPDNNQKYNIEISLLNDSKLKLNFTNINQNNSKQIDININLIGDNSEAIVNATSLNLNGAKTWLNINGISKEAIKSKIDIQISGIIDNDNAKFIGCPKFIFKSNTIEARHGLIVGMVNQNEMNYLMSRSISESDAKLMLVSSKILSCLEYLDEEQKNKYKNKIKEVWN